MAIQHSLSITGSKVISSHGFLYPMGEETVTTDPLYIKVVSVSGNKETLTASVSFSLEKTTAPLAVKDYQFTLELEGPNPIKQAYEYLKTLPEFADAVDC